MFGPCKFFQKMEFHSAPLQGYTDAPWRKFHRMVYGNSVDRYYSPFLRLEKGEMRRRDVNDITSDLNDGVPFTPQIIFRDAAEFQALADAVRATGHKAIDLNLGCPFPPQVKKGRGCGMLGNLPELEKIAQLMAEEFADVEFSVKMRLGISEPNEWEASAAIINAMPLSQVTLHPRVGRQQYGGELFMDEFAKFSEQCQHPLIFNGDIASTEQIEAISAQFPGLKGVMAGRGLLARPSLAEEWRTGKEWDQEVRIAHLLQLHSLLLDDYANRLCGDAQILMKIKPFWDYLEPEIGHKAAKAIKKANSLTAYESAIRNIQ